MSDAEVEQMMKDAELHAEEDKNAENSLKRKTVQIN